MDTEFGPEMRRLRTAAMKTLKEAAEAMGNVSIPYISDIERGRRNPPSPEKIRVLLTFFDAEGETDRMTSLAAKERGSMQISTSDADTTDMLVALHRRIESRSLDAKLIREIQDLLRRKESGR